MVNLPVSHVTRRARSRPSRFRVLLSAAEDLLHMFGAATRVAAAVEARREPDPEDLTVLGIKGKLPRAW